MIQRAWVRAQGRRKIWAASLAVLGLAALSACSTGAAGAASSSYAGVPEDAVYDERAGDMLPGVKVGWLNDGSDIALTTYGSSSCPVGPEAIASLTRARCRSSWAHRTGPSVQRTPPRRLSKSQPRMDSIRLPPWLLRSTIRRCNSRQFEGKGGSGAQVTAAPKRLHISRLPAKRRGSRAPTGTSCGNLVADLRARWLVQSRKTHRFPGTMCSTSSSVFGNFSGTLHRVP